MKNINKSEIKSPENRILRFLIPAMYIFSVFVSLAALMGYSGIWDLRFYAIQVVLMAAVLVPKIIKR